MSSTPSQSLHLSVSNKVATDPVCTSTTQPSVFAVDAPALSYTLCVRLIRSFIYRNTWTIVIRNIDPEMTIADFIIRINSVASSTDSSQTCGASPVPKPFATMHYDSIKIDCVPHGFKGSDSIVNKHDGTAPLTASDTRTMREVGIVNGTDLCAFNLPDYQDYIDGPCSNMKIKWNQFGK
ncbi:hypothetical protein GJ496_004724 [Pomphorhynchus laevis]|nr:hypothetical protein GJ496_010249 [Pomphorhynchus laevis]KAI0987895.1 hypothetical protein GJ496_004724 [Pomphorhynchus laevis]